MSKPKKGTELYFVKLMQKAQKVMTKKFRSVGGQSVRAAAITVQVLY